MPDVDENRLPPRNFFFQIMSSIRPENFSELLADVEVTRKKKMAEKDELICVKPEVWKELADIRLEKVFVSNPPSKRVVRKSKSKL